MFHIPLYAVSLFDCDVPSLLFITGLLEVDARRSAEHVYEPFVGLLEHRAQEAQQCSRSWRRAPLLARIAHSERFVCVCVCVGGEWLDEGVGVARRE